MKKVIIHIGGHKTGSTAIQVALSNNYKVLDGCGVCYPIDLLGEPEWAKGHHSIVHYLLGNVGFSKSISKTDSDPITYLKNVSRDQNLVLSSEEFLKLSEHHLEVFCNSLEGFDKEIVLYVRRQDEVAQGLYQTVIVNESYSGSFHDYFSENKDLFDYKKILLKWRSVFCDVKFTVRAYHPKYLNNSNSVNDFISVLERIFVLGVAPKEWKIPKGALNFGYPEHVVSMIRYFNKINRRPDMLPLMIEISKRLYSGRHGTYELIPPSMRLKVMDYYRDSNFYVRSEFFPEEDFLLFSPDDISAGDESWKKKYEGEGAFLKLLFDDVLKIIN